MSETVEAFFADAGMQPNVFYNHYQDVDGRTMPGFIRMVAKYAAPRWEARLYTTLVRTVPVWKSPPFEDPISAFVYAQTANWGQ
ncbi:hypothetical protein [Pseudomonas mediterranea]|uniref:hypothetical protein n=1 Tax=Pseudomonas mediterranea TaxID=183795 RepID=UPI0006D8A85E|nr:hypothetical protein [Pseudomonas mediterranea]